MPFYEYRCSDCEKTFTAMRKMDARNDPIECEHCKSNNTTLNVTTNKTMFQLKGDKWRKGESFRRWGDDTYS
jgi:putative FmdB family regulatory protein